MSKYRLILAEKANFEVTMMCRLLEVARSAYYAWVARPPSARACRAAALAARIATLHEDSDGTYGAPRILADLRAEGEVVSSKTVAKSMRANGLRGCSPPRWRTTTEPETDPANIPADRVARRFDRGRLDAVWVGDVTYLRTWEGWLYLATVIDAHSRRVIGWAVTDHMRASLVTDALTMAIVHRGHPVTGVIFHSDRGVQGGFEWSSQHLEGGGVGWDRHGVERGGMWDGRRCGRRGGRESVCGRPSGRSGSASRRACRVRTLRRRAACRRRWGRAGFVTLAGWHLSI